MKEQLTTLAALAALTALGAGANSAHAQSAVTMFGIIDLSVRGVSNGSAGTLRTLSTDGQATSRLGLRGDENLGGGLRAGFWLEGALAPDTGGGAKTAANQNGSGADPMNWQRRSTVSLAGGFGEIRMGRDTTATFANFSAFDPFGYSGVSTVANVRGSFLGSGGATTALRASNAISWFLPTLGGFSGQLQVAAGEGAQGNKYAGGRLGYAAGALSVSAALGKTYRSGTAIDDLKTMNAGAAYNFGFATLQASYEKSDYATSSQKLASVAALIPLGAGTIKFDIVDASGHPLAGSALANSLDARLLGAGYVYELSKRTSVYLGYARIANGGNGVNGANYTASANGPSGIKRGEASTAYDLGIRHNF